MFRVGRAVSMSRRLFLTLHLLGGLFLLFSTPTRSHTDYPDPSRGLLADNYKNSPNPTLSLGRHVLSLTGGAKPGFPMGSEVASRSRSRLETIRRTLFPVFGRREVTKFLLLGSIKFFVILALTLTRDTKG